MADQRTTMPIATFFTVAPRTTTTIAGLFAKRIGALKQTVHDGDYLLVHEERQCGSLAGLGCDPSGLYRKYAMGLALAG